MKILIFGHTQLRFYNLAKEKVNKTHEYLKNEHTNA